MSAKIRMVHPDPNASTSMGDADESGGFLIEPSQVEEAKAHGFQVSHTVETDNLIRGEAAADDAGDGQEADDADGGSDGDDASEEAAGDGAQDEAADDPAPAAAPRRGKLRK